MKKQEKTKKERIEYILKNLGKYYDFEESIHEILKDYDKYWDWFLKIAKERLNDYTLKELKELENE